MPVRLHALYRKASALHPRELWLLVLSVGLLAALPVLQRVLPLPTLVTVFGTRTIPTVFPPLQPERLLFLIRGLLDQRIGMIRPNCMKQSLVLFHFLRQWGAPVTIHFGVAKPHDALEGHCWIELAGQPFGERGDPHRAFAMTYTFPMDSDHHKRRLEWIAGS